MSTPEAAFKTRRIRQRGLKTFIIGAILYAVILAVMYWLSAHGCGFHFMLIPACVPFAIAGIGFIELVGGVPFDRLGRRWMDLRGWQRGVLGVFIVAASLAIILCVVTFFVMLFT